MQSYIKLKPKPRVNDERNPESLIRSAHIELYCSQMPAILVADVVTIWGSCYALFFSWTIINTLLALVFAFFV